MTDAELAAEQEAIALEHADLKAEHTRLEHDASDMPRFIEHSRKLHEHVDRQQALIAAWRERKQST